MHVKVRNVNEAFNTFVAQIRDGVIPTTRKDSRAGEVLKIDEPVLLTFEKPTERVLFNQARDCNPFFHVYEALWMLAGRNDVAPLKYYSSKIGEVASDDGTTFNGAYGWRWRRHPGKPTPLPNTVGYSTKAIDQLPIIINHLKDKPESRRAVLQMWRVVDDLMRIDQHGTIPATKDVCCNTAAYFSLRKVEKLVHNFGDPVREVIYLDMTVTNRSNDLIWGLLGANVVHFSFLQEYLAGALGVEVGYYHQFANDLHVYTKNNGGYKPEVWLESELETTYTYSYELDGHNRVHVPLVRDVVMFDKEVEHFVSLNYGVPAGEFPGDHFDPQIYGESTEWVEPFLAHVAQPMCHAFHAHKRRDYSAAKNWCEGIVATDWRIAATNWIKKREAGYKAKAEKGAGSDAE